MNPDPIIGRRQFTDGVTREVCRDADGQYVIGDDGPQVRAVWLFKEDEADTPLVLTAERLS